jgi:hypothetical protein
MVDGVHLYECTAKLSTDRNMVSVYDSWTHVLRGNPAARLKLNHDDYLFFFGATGADDARKTDGDELHADA